MLRRPSVLAVAVVTGGLLMGLGHRAAHAKAYTLPELLEAARRGNPGIQAGAAATDAMQAQLLEAHRNAWPSGELTSFITAVPRIQCVYDTPVSSQNNFGNGPIPQTCVATTSDPAHHNFWDTFTKLSGPFSRTEIRLVQPVYTFGKIDAGVEAAENGVAAVRHKQAGAAADVELNIRKAYWGRKLARELLDTLDQGTSYIDEAQQKIEKQLADGSGNVTVTDRLRLRTVRAEIDARTLETKRMAELALTGLRTLLGSEAPADLDVDAEPLEPLEVPKRPVTHYEEAARLNRPEVLALGFAARAKHALSLLEQRREYPDVALVATGSYAYAPSVDSPVNAFANNPFNGLGFGLAATLRMPLDLGPRFARTDRARAEADETELRRREALGGIALEVRKAFDEMTEAQARVAAVQKGEKAGKAWVTAVAQNFAIGLAEARDFSDALQAFFTMRARYLQSVYDLNIAAAALTRATGAPVP
ncbi:MAG TPA: TolC family protein [Polyangia bacterium]